MTPEEKRREFFRTIGRKGGLVKTPKGFATNKKLAREAGRKGGKASYTRGSGMFNQEKGDGDGQTNQGS